MLSEISYKTRRGRAKNLEPSRARARDAAVEEVREEAAEGRLAERAAGAGAPEVREEPGLEAAAVADAGREGVLVEGPAQAERRAGLEVGAEGVERGAPAGRQRAGHAPGERLRNILIYSGRRT